MPKFKVTCEHEVIKMYRVTVDADSLEEAVRLVEYGDYDSSNKRLLDEEDIRINVTYAEQLEDKD
ncbi:hypothetical protein BSP38_178 [Bacillus phage BSP38]|uniref:Uncharacterized protein n=1 Tax=Bacillus phage BSP38 TaxID=2283013 RepID=A0A345MK38_BPBSP|nr:hypothetical protein HWB82_gp140 [Bacillus phage BSP38]AXH71220.1 hypothetical protein BSP38_178 [Bacillus phage BSP38]